jgi:two-component system, chemotaxis family, protein-glutamate methylesterase/glutaminase
VVNDRETNGACDVAVVGASAGGVETLRRLVAQLPADYPGAVFVVLHISSHGTSMLPGILGRVSRLPVTHAVDGEEIERRHVYVAPPDYHLLIEDGRLRLDRGPRENGHRPAIDPLFRTASASYDGRVVGVVLSGTLDDGTDGMRTIVRQGGVGIAQDPDEALYRTMPESAIEYGGAGEVMSVDDIAARLEQLATEGRPPRPRGREGRVTGNDEPIGAEKDDPTAFLTCPDCGGVLTEIDDAGIVRFRCQIGHQYSEQSLIALHPERLEYALWMAVRALKERADLSTRVAQRFKDRGNVRTARRFERDAEQSREAMTTLRRTITALEPPPLAEESAVA